MSLNQITDAILAFAGEHGQLKTADFRAPYDWSADVDNVYPAFFFDLLSSQRVPNQRSYTFEGFVVDRAAEGQEREVLSDAIEIADDIISWIGGQDFTLVGEPQMFPFVESTSDVLAGVRFEFTVRATVPLDRCAIPYKPEELSEYLLTESGDFILLESGDKIILE